MTQPATQPAQRGGPSALARTQDHLKQLVYGGNDGIVTTFAIVAGFAGAGAEGVAQIGALAVLVFGLANLFADAVSMGLGEFLSMRSQNDLYDQRHAAQIKRIAADQEAETARMADLLQTRGLPEDEAVQTARLLAAHPPLMADLTLSWGYGMQAPEDANPALNGMMTFLSFVVFGAVPLSPYFVMEPTQATFYLSVATTLLALIALGLLRWVATRDRLRRALFETVAVGSVCALVAYAVGWLVGG
jgi:VIT1/CCC1 family predicted Fe2+/Mn2+ transporter